MVNSESEMGVKPGDSWSAEQFLAHSHIYPGFTGKVSSLTHFPPGTRL